MVVVVVVVVVALRLPQVSIKPSKIAGVHWWQGGGGLLSLLSLVLKQILHLKQMEKCVRKTNEHSFKIPNFTSKTNQKLRKTLNDIKFFPF